MAIFDQGFDFGSISPGQAPFSGLPWALKSSFGPAHLFNAFYRWHSLPLGVPSAAGKPTPVASDLQPLNPDDPLLGCHRGTGWTLTAVKPDALNPGKKGVAHDARARPVSASKSP